MSAALATREDLGADPVHQYLQQLRRVPLLTAEQEVDLAKRIEAGVFAAELLTRQDGHAPHRRADLEQVRQDGESAWRQLITANTRLVVSIASRYTGRGLDLADLISEGNFGLFRAVEKFDYTRGLKFSTYATWWIRQAIQRGLYEHSKAIRLPIHIHELLNRLNRVEAELQRDLQRAPSADEVAAAAGETVDRVHQVRQISRPVYSLAEPLYDAEFMNLGDLIAAQRTDGRHVDIGDQVVEGERHADLTRLLSALPDQRQARILTLRFGLEDGHPRTLDEVGKAIGLTRERIRQIEKQALALLRDHPLAATLAAD